LKAYIQDIEYYLPPNILSNEDLNSQNPDWNIEKISELTGIKTRHIVSTETSLDLGESAAKKLFKKNTDLKEKIDYLIFCSQSPDYFLPTSACVLQDKLGLNTRIGAVDVNQGCSGFVYSLGIAKGLIESNQCLNVLIITSETYSKFINPKDKSVRTLFGDGACAILVSCKESPEIGILPVIHGTDGSGYDQLIVPHGGLRNPLSRESYNEIEDESGNIRSQANLYMNGRAIHNFTIKKIPNIFQKTLEKSNMRLDDIDSVIFHQANKFILNNLQKKIKIPDEKIHRSYETIGNTVSSTIPIGLAKEKEKRKSVCNYLILGFGVGLSWAGSVVKY
jgi:3-oxoacyl-[acyl-carrier-protein] synthase-3